METLKQNFIYVILVGALLLIGLRSPVVNVTVPASDPTQAVGAAISNLSTIGNPFTFTNSANPGGVTFASTTATDVKIGQTSNKNSILTAGTCNLWVGGNTTIAASTTVAYDCGSGTTAQATLADVPVFAVGDVVLMSAPTTTTQTFLGLEINAVSASSTAGYIRVQLTNKTGGTYTIASSSMNAYQYMFIR